MMSSKSRSAVARSISGRMFELEDTLNYEPSVMQSFLVRAKQAGITPLEAIYDHLSAGQGDGLIYFPIDPCLQGGWTPHQVRGDRELSCLARFIVIPGLRPG